MSKGREEGKCLRELQSNLEWLEQDRLVDKVGKMSWNQMVKGVISSQGVWIRVPVMVGDEYHAGASCILENPSVFITSGNLFNRLYGTTFVNYI